MTPSPRPQTASPCPSGLHLPRGWDHLFLTCTEVAYPPVGSQLRQDLYGSSLVFSAALGEGTIL